MVFCRVKYRFLANIGLFLLFAFLTASAQWISLGPNGGDARSLAVDPSNPDRVFLGTSAGELFLSTDRGASWTRYAHLGENYDYVLDHIAIVPSDPAVMYVSAWSIENNGGDLFKSTDHGRTWTAMPAMRGKSIRAMALSPSDSRAIAVGALDGVYRSLDGGQNWERISPASSAEIKNIESIAFDPRSVHTVYAGTWHLPWKTEDGGRTWENIKQGIIDDSDVFSIIVDQKNPSVVYVSACSGIYKSETAGAQFKKVQGIPFSARRTRVLHQDPTNSAVVYAGTTDGLWKTVDSGQTWARVSGANLIINDVLVDPRDPNAVLLATDRSGVLMSRDGGNSFADSNRGFSHRQVTAVVVDRDDPERIYAAMINNREYGGVYQSRDSGRTWSAWNFGLGARDIFSLDQSDDGTIVAGTNQGVFSLKKDTGKWNPINLVLREKTTTIPVKPRKKGAPKTRIKREWIKSAITGRAAQVRVGNGTWFAATAQGLFKSKDSGASWTGGAVLGQAQFVAVDTDGKKVLAASPVAVLLSDDLGESWKQLELPPFVSRIFNVAVGPNGDLWIVTHMGTFRSRNTGGSWEHISAGYPPTKFSYVRYDRAGARLIGVAGARNRVYQSFDGGDTWSLQADAVYPIRNLSVAQGRILAVTDFSGVISQTGQRQSSASGGGSR
ncbi:MAG TPA: hypothetical protein VN577_00955 [Terriglobales bacterium]|nr:hypothetical protein [Terriglobales bacterium]